MWNLFLLRLTRCLIVLGQQQAPETPCVVVDLDLTLLATLLSVLPLLDLRVDNSVKSLLIRAVQKELRGVMQEIVEGTGLR